MSSAPVPGPVCFAHLGRKVRRQLGVRLLPLVASACLAAGAQADPDPDPDPAPAPPPPPVIDVPEVTISATRSEQNVLDVPGNVTVIDRAMIERSGEQTVPDLLRREAGLFVTNTTTNPGSYNVEARGFSNGGGNGCNTLVLVDGRRINEADTSCPDWSFVSLDEIERIEVIRGPVSAMYGDNGVGGVIHIITRQGRAEPGLRAAVQGRAGSYDTDGGSLQLEGAEGPLSATAFVDSDRTDAYRHHADFDRDAGNLALRYELGPLATLELGGGYASVDRQQPGDLTKEEWNQNPRQAEPGAADNFDTERQRFVDSRLELRPIDGVTVTVLPSYQSTSQHTLLEDPTSTFSNQFEMDVWSVPTQLAWNDTLLGRKNQLLVGADWLQEEVDANSLLAFTGDGSFPGSSHTRRTILGLFVNDELWLREDLLLSLGVRHDHSDAKAKDEISNTDFHETHDVWSPRAALTWRVVDPASLYVSWARGFRFPNRDETFGFFGFAPGLAPETSESYEIGAKLRRPGVTANLAFYQMNVHDEIFLDPSLVDGQIQNRNIDRVRHRGIELSGSWQPVAWFELSGSYTYDDVEIESDGTDPAIEGSTMPITPHNRGDVAATFILPYGFEVGGNAYWVGSRILANDVPNTDEELDSFATYDARIAWSHDLAAHLRLGLSVTGYNLTNRNYAEFGGESLVFFPGQPQEVGFFPSPERHYVAAVRLEIRP